MVLLEAGHEATVNTLGNGMRAILQHPGEWQRVVGGAVSPRIAVEEMLRWDPPLQLFERWVLEDGVEIAGQTIELGQEVAMLFGAAQRDPRRFDNPEDFDIIPPDQDLYCVSLHVGEPSSILKLPRQCVASYVGDLLITQAGEDVFGPTTVFIVSWNGADFEVRRIPLPSVIGGEIEHVTFAPLVFPALNP